MSSILLSNPFATQPAPQAAAAPPGAAQTTYAVAPATGSNASSGAGAGFGNSGQMAGQNARPRSDSGPFVLHGDATRNSVVSAQAQAEHDAPLLPTNQLPEVDMPDPLPTSPLLMALRDAR